MPPLPKRKHSKGRTRRRRAHDALKLRNLVFCANCGHMRLPHSVCSHCGFFKGREVISVEE
ncbi:MAG: 50S ribosomal protein L32 [Chloroflexota bacterium]